MKYGQSVEAYPVDTESELIYKLPILSKEAVKLLVELELFKNLESKTKEILNIYRSNTDADTTALESQIDQLVYQLYGLTEEEIRIVEGA